MIISATDIKNNFGKYLQLLWQEDIIVTRSGKPVAKITKLEDWDFESIVAEHGVAYNYQGKRMSFDEFLEMYEKSNERYEYIDGEVYLLASPKSTHQQIIGNIYTIFRSWFGGKKCRPYLSPFDVKIVKNGKHMNMVQPDVLVICDPENMNDKDKYEGVPALVVEVMSESSVRHDLVRKLDLYLNSGVQEYWIVNYKNKEVSVYQFKDNRIENMKQFVRDDTAKSFIFKGLDVGLPEIFA